MLGTIERIQRHIETIEPGMATAFTNACVAGDTIRQGDLYLIIANSVPDGFVIDKSGNTQLVIGNTQGSKHCLDSLDGVKLYYPSDYDKESLVGPCMVLTQDRTVLHPVHGDVLCLAGQTIRTRYQREWDKEERRARD